LTKPRGRAAPSPWDFDDGFDARAALDQYVRLVLPAFDVDRVRMRAVAARARANARKTAATDGSRRPI
jgi:hypothetical protein